MTKFTLTGDFAGLQRLIDRVDRVSRPKVLEQVSRNLSEEAIELVADGFEHQRAPSGSAWKPKKRSDGRAILVGKTARLRRGWHVAEVGAAGFKVAPAVAYAKWHQGGTSRMAARPMIPGPTLPRSWRDRFVETATQVLIEHLEG